MVPRVAEHCGAVLRAAEQYGAILRVLRIAEHLRAVLKALRIAEIRRRFRSG